MIRVGEGIGRQSRGEERDQAKNTFYTEGVFLYCNIKLANLGLVHILHK